MPGTAGAPPASAAAATAIAPGHLSRAPPRAEPEAKSRPALQLWPNHPQARRTLGGEPDHRWSDPAGGSGGLGPAPGVGPSGRRCAGSPARPPASARSPARRPPRRRGGSGTWIGTCRQPRHDGADAEPTTRTCGRPRDQDPPCGRRATAVSPLSPSPPQTRRAASRRHASSSTSSRLQNANRTSVRAASTSSWNTDTGTPTTPARAGSSWQKASASVAPSGAASAMTKYVPERHRHRHPGPPQPLDEPVALGRQRRRQPGVHGIRQPEPGSDRRLERPRRHVGEELLHRPHRRHRLGRARAPSRPSTRWSRTSCPPTRSSGSATASPAASPPARARHRRRAGARRPRRSPPTRRARAPARRPARARPA